MYLSDNSAVNDRSDDMVIQRYIDMQIRPYGDTANDGIVQLSFTLPLPLNARAREAARRYAMLMGINAC